MATAVVLKELCKNGQSKLNCHTERLWIFSVIRRIIRVARYIRKSKCIKDMSSREIVQIWQTNLNMKPLQYDFGHNSKQVSTEKEYTMR